MIDLGYGPKKPSTPTLILRRTQRTSSRAIINKDSISIRVVVSIKAHQNVPGRRYRRDRVGTSIRRVRLTQMCPLSCVRNVYCIFINKKSVLLLVYIACCSSNVKIAQLENRRLVSSIVRGLETNMLPLSLLNAAIGHPVVTLFFCHSML